MRKVYVEIKVKATILADDNADISEIINEAEYSFNDTTTQATFEDTEIVDYKVNDSK